MDSQELRRRFLEFFEKRGHTIVPSSSLVPDDPSVLLTTAGMQQFKPYYTELDPEKTVHPSLGKPVGLNVASSQKSFRTSDIDEVGDERHLTFFEMLGNFSFGGYFKERAIALAHEFITGELGLKISYVTVFEGKDSIGVSKDKESIALWKSLDPQLKIVEQGMEDVFWGPTGSSGPCGPTTEVYCTNAAGQDIEIWNIVFNQYFYPGSRQELDAGAVGKKLRLLEKPGVDTGMGLERLAMIVQKKSSIFETDVFVPIIQSLPTADTDQRVKRIIADHARAIAFLISDGVRPLNKGQGYILRKLIRRSIVLADLKSGGSFAREDTLSMGFQSDLRKVLEAVVGVYRVSYPDLDLETIVSVFDEERKKFGLAFRRGIHEIEKMEKVDAKKAFKIYETYGLPFEVIVDPLVVGEKSEGLRKDAFEKELEKHQEISRAGVERKFGGHGLILDTGELKAANEEELKVVTRLHTATHLLQAALRKVLGDSVHQAGSDITPERTRFDFTFDRRMTDEEVRQVEELVNEAIKRNLDMGYKEMAFQEAVALGALYSKKEKYPDMVKVYSAQDIKTGEVFSRELCGGPHVEHTGSIGKFRILKQESVGAGVKRIKARVE